MTISCASVCACKIDVLPYLLPDHVFVNHITTRPGNVPPTRPGPSRRCMTGPVLCPLSDVRIPHGVPFGGVCHGTDAAPELGVDEVSGSLPSEVRVVARVVCVELSQVGGQLSRRRELIDVDVRVWWRHLEVVLGRRAHHNRDDVVAMKHYNWDTCFFIYVVILVKCVQIDSCTIRSESSTILYSLTMLLKCSFLTHFYVDFWKS